MPLTGEAAKEMAVILVNSGMIELDALIAALMEQVGDYRTKLLLKSMIDLVDMPALDRTARVQRPEAVVQSSAKPNGDAIVSFTVTRCDQDRRIQLIKRIRELFGIGLREAKELTEGTYRQLIVAGSVERVKDDLRVYGAEGFGEEPKQRATQDERDSAYRVGDSGYSNDDKLSTVDYDTIINIKVTSRNLINKIEIIKVVRGATNWALKESKDFVDGNAVGRMSKREFIELRTQIDRVSKTPVTFMVNDN